MRPLTVQSFLTVCRAKRRKIPSMIPQDLLDILVCPVCKKPLVLKDEGQSLKCGECRRVYPVRDGIPIMLVDEADRPRALLKPYCVIAAVPQRHNVSIEWRMSRYGPFVPRNFYRLNIQRFSSLATYRIVRGLRNQTARLARIWRKRPGRGTQNCMQRCMAGSESNEVSSQGRR